MKEETREKEANKRQEVKTALFFNFTDEPFIGYWDGKAKTFKPGAKLYMELWRAEHYAKHLANQVLMKEGGVKENYTSPKFPDEVPEFKKLFDKACIPEENEDEEQDQADLINKQHEPSMNIPKEVPVTVDKQGAKITKSPDDEDASFEGLEDNKIEKND